MQVNRLRLHAQIEYPTIQLTVNYSSQKLFRSYFRVNESKTILLSIETSKLYYRTEGRLSTNYTNFTLDLPIVDQDEKQSHCLITFLADGTSLTFNLTSDHRQEYFLQLFHRFTFAHRYLAQSHTSILLEMMHYPLFVCNSSMEFEENSTVLQSWNGSMHLPPLFVSKPFVLVYKRHAPWFIQFFHWANLTRTWNRTELITPFGLKASMTNDVLKRISLRLEQVLLDKRLLFLFEIDRHWILSLVVNNRTRYELTFFSSESSVRLKHIDLGRNQVRQLTLNYSTDNETFFRTEIAFSKYFSAFINDFIVELSMKNHTLKFLCHIPLFRREFLSLTWKRHLHRDLFHFQGAIQMNLLRRRRIFDYDYQWNLASMALWTMKSRLAMFSLDPIEWTLDLNNDYLWSGKWVVDFRLILAARRELIRLHHEYHYHHLVSKILFDVILMNKRYDLALNYSHLNHSIRGQFIDNNGQHQIDGAWNSTDNLLLLNTQDMTSRTTITSNSIRTIVHQRLQKLGILIERSNDRFTQDTEILQVSEFLPSDPRAPLLF